MTEDQLFQLWDGWLDRIYKDVQNLVIGRHVYTEVQKIVQNNPRLHKPSSFYDLMTMTFSAWAAMAVRRQQEAYSISVVRLLQELEKRPEVLSRKRFVDTFANKMLAGSPGEEPAQPDDERDRPRAERVGDAVATFADRRVRVGLLLCAALLGLLGGLADVSTNRTQAGQVAAVDNEVLISNRGCFEEALEDFTCAGGVTRLRGQTRT